MDKITLVIDRRDIRLSKDGQALRIDRPDDRLQRIPMGMLGQVIIHGNPVVDCSVWRKLSEKGIPALLLPTRGRDASAILGPVQTGNIMVRIAQWQTWSDPGLKMKAAVWILDKKLRGYIRLAEALDRDAGFLRSGLTRLGGADSLDALRGIEGAAARGWFAAMGEWLSPDWGFTGRNRRPPRDPVNALLSLGYTIMMSEVRKAVHGRGLESCLGFLHEPYPGRESLVLDLAEPFRPGVDAIVLDMARDLLSPKDFTAREATGCRLSKDGRGKFYRTFEDTRSEWPLSPVKPEDEEAGGDLATMARQLAHEFARTWGAPETEAGE